MKLDKIRFARLIGFLERVHALNLKQDDVELIDEIIDIEVPEAPAKAACADVNSLLAAVYYGRKIDAIKAYRQLTGAGLKESKDAVEQYWHVQLNTIEMLNKIKSI